MIVSEEVFREIVMIFENHRGTFRELKNALINFYNLPESTVSSLLIEECKRKVKKNIYKLNANSDRFYSRYMKSRASHKSWSMIIKLAEELKISNTLMARMILEKYLEQDDRVKDSQAKNKVKHCLKDSTSIEDQDLAFEVFLCGLYDELNGNLSDTIRSSLGHEYESHLQRILRERNLTFQCENDLRSQGYDKTPDIKLNAPFAVDGFIVNWIESKALFANPRVHKEYIEKQYYSYWNRFGTGLVIYWMGLVESVINPKENKFIVRYDFPDNITRINPFSIASIPKGLTYNGKVLERTSENEHCKNNDGAADSK